ncbi:hypothetical protein BYT27DRAFT_7216022 [Phlegmacium glaucopus]|nr:hypothetical protein BYT27DRAFT_7216022 [Phlegmacium glaucopus]
MGKQRLIFWRTKAGQSTQTQPFSIMIHRCTDAPRSGPAAEPGCLELVQRQDVRQMEKLKALYQAQTTQLYFTLYHALIPHRGEELRPRSWVPRISPLFQQFKQDDPFGEPGKQAFFKWVVWKQAIGKLQNSSTSGVETGNADNVGAGRAGCISDDEHNEGGEGIHRKANGDKPHPIDGSSVTSGPPGDHASHQKKATIPFPKHTSEVTAGNINAPVKTMHSDRKIEKKHAKMGCNHKTLLQAESLL